MEALRDYFLSYKPYASLLTAAILLLLWMGLRKFVRRRLIRNGPHDRREGHIQLALNIAKYILFLLAAVVILNINGVDVSSIVTGLGVAGIVVGFALQDVLQDWIAGIGILWEKYFSVGDAVKYGEYEGEVLEFNLKCTKIRDSNNGSLVVVSNRHLSEIELLADWFEVDIPAPLDVPAARMRDICGEIAGRMGKTEGCQACRAQGAQRFTDYCALYHFRIDCDERLRGNMRRALNGIAQDVYAEKGIPFPSRAVALPSEAQSAE